VNAAVIFNVNKRRASTVTLFNTSDAPQVFADEKPADSVDSA
jgi:hypothetical protein